MQFRVQDGVLISRGTAAEISPINQRVLARQRAAMGDRVSCFTRPSLSTITMNGGFDHCVYSQLEMYNLFNLYFQHREKIRLADIQRVEQLMSAIVDEVEQARSDPALYTQLSSTVQARCAPHMVRIEELNRQNSLPQGIMRIGNNNGGSLVSAEYADIHQAELEELGKRMTRKLQKQSGKKKVAAVVITKKRYFDSQTSFVVKGTLSGTRQYYKIKLFGPGTFQIPGGCCDDLSDVLGPLLSIQRSMREAIGVWSEHHGQPLPEHPVTLAGFHPVMCNYRFKLTNPDLLISAPALLACIEEDTKHPFYEQYCRDLLDQFDPEDRDSIMKSLRNFHPQAVADTNYNTDASFNVACKFVRPLKTGRPNNQTTLKAMKRGALSIDGDQSREAMLVLYYWIEDIFHRNWKRIVHNPAEITAHDSSDDDLCDNLSDARIYSTDDDDDEDQDDQ